MILFTPLKEGWTYYRLHSDEWVTGYAYLAVPDYDRDDEELLRVNCAFWVREEARKGLPGPIDEHGWLRDAIPVSDLEEYYDDGTMTEIPFAEMIEVTDPLWDLDTGVADAGV